MTSNNKLPERVLTVKEAAERLGLTQKALRRKLDKKQVPYLKLGKLVRFDPEKLMQWANKNQHEPIEGK